MFTNNNDQKDLVTRIETYSKGDYIEEFYKEVQEIGENEEKLIQAISKMCSNLGKLEYKNHFNKLSPITPEPVKFIKYTCENKGLNFYQRYKCRKNLSESFDKTYNVQELPSKIIKIMNNYKTNNTIFSKLYE